MANYSAIADSFLSDAGWLFFAGFTAVIAFVSLKAFGREIFRSQAPIERATPKTPQR